MKAGQAHDFNRGRRQQKFSASIRERGLSYTDEHRPFPTFKNVLDNVDSYIAAHARYGPEVRQNLTAALTLRTETMYSGAMGSLFSNAKGLQAAEILAAPCVIELADFSP